ncbi:MAG: tRNA1(Val) (adenine(37)-N6)-methyltransferase [Phocaeicola sp.]|uniref:tRNA1(Val) (adenine(37)-N6)-methyltransferase n=1 Tax=Phocaeicola TaxID=909656 RepID=UPI00234ED1A9|nr:tRNA1(Val) (adenine(37)-N6)-methyltransferase [Phocaeicola oris]MCE2616378.1 tRNA1(Val) (adenine(37)-N6)-methyltransferase [Phocaeicola oris]
MSNSYFAFKQFVVHHDRCAMKVGTDGVLLGAWTDVEKATRVLDIGTGTGLIALMLAQRSKAKVTAVEIDKDACAQAMDNVRLSPWKERIEVIQTDVRTYRPERLFDCIVANPPYFVNSLKSPDEQRSVARHTGTLSFRELLQSVANLITNDGMFSVVLPFEALNEFWSTAMEFRLCPSRQTTVFSKPNTSAKRVLLELKPQICSCKVNRLVIEEEPHVFSDDFKNLTRDFYQKV